MFPHAPQDLRFAVGFRGYAREPVDTVVEQCELSITETWAQLERTETSAAEADGRVQALQARVSEFEEAALWDRRWLGWPTISSVGPSRSGRVSGGTPSQRPRPRGANSPKRGKSRSRRALMQKRSSQGRAGACPHPAQQQVTRAVDYGFTSRTTTRLASVGSAQLS